eukprot:787078-Prymnesium_polylepis.1
MSQCQPDDVLSFDGTIGPFTVTCGLVGTNVTLFLPGTTRTLAIDEIEVVGRTLMPSPPPPPPPSPPPSSPPVP